MIDFDLESGVLRLDIDDLVAAGGTRPGAVDDALDAVGSDAWMGYLDEGAPPGYLPRVSVECEASFEGLDVEVHGTADGLYETGPGLVVEVARLAPDTDDGGAARAIERVGWLAWALTLAGKRVHKGSLVLLETHGRAAEKVDVAFSLEAFERRFEVRMETLLGGFRREREASESRRVLGERLAFPFDEVRAGQDVMLRDVDGAVDSGLVLLVSAPTGIGKTAGALYPFLRRALLEDRRLFFATAKVSQQSLALDTLRAMLPAGGGGLAVQIAAKDRVCPLERQRCVERRCPLQREFGGRLAASGLLDQLGELGVVDAETLAPAALDAGLCPFEVSLALAERASAIVCDFNYVFDPNAYLRRFFDEPYDSDLLVVDEAHNLPTRAADYYSPELKRTDLVNLGAACDGLSGAAYHRVGALFADVLDHCDTTAVRLSEERSTDPPHAEPPDPRFWADLLRRAAETIIDYGKTIGQESRRPPALMPVRGTRDDRLRDPVLAALYAVRDFARHASEGDRERFAAVWTAEGAKMRCLDPSPEIGERIAGFGAAVLMSATLSPHGFYARTLGADGPRCEVLDLPSPFPRDHRLFTAVTNVDTTYRHRDDESERIGELITRSMALRAGNYLAFFSSFVFRDQVLSRMSPGDYRVLLQLPGMPTRPILDKLRRGPLSGSQLLAGVLGGVFAEGVDYPGDMAIGVFVVGPGLPQVGLDRELVREYYDQRLGAGFEYAYVHPGLNRVVQAGGRAIRTPTDRAFTMLIGRRFGEPRYRDPLPAWWREDLEAIDDPLPLLKAFWD